jgi:hypothetical protein
MKRPGLLYLIQFHRKPKGCVESATRPRVAPTTVLRRMAFNGERLASRLAMHALQSGHSTNSYSHTTLNSRQPRG